MATHALRSRETAKSIGIGIGIAILLSAVMVPAFLMGLSPMPKPLGLAFAQALLGKVPLPVGLLFHVIYVTGVTTLYLTYVQERPTFAKALGFALLLWAVVLLVFFPLVGWGPLGLNIGPQLIVAALVPHLLYALLLWWLPRRVF